MIKVRYNQKFIKISGHADFNNYGKDIVCASASSIIYTTLNAILNINSKAIKYTDAEEFKIEVLSNDQITRKLITNMLDLLQELEKQYPQNIKLVKENEHVTY